MKRKAKIVAFVTMGALIGGATMIVLSQPVKAKPEFSAQTQKPCRTCHLNPGGGGKLKPYGEAFKANGFKLKK